MKTLLILISLNIFCVSNSIAILPGGDVQTGETDQTETIRIYMVTGQETEGRLTEIRPPEFYHAPVPDHRFQMSPVIMDRHLPYPNPYSHPIVVITVGRHANFTIEVEEPPTIWMDKFEFENIEEGLYLFTLHQPIRMVDRFYVTLLHDGSRVGRSFIPNTVLNRLK